MTIFKYFLDLVCHKLACTRRKIFLNLLQQIAFKFNTNHKIYKLITHLDWLRIYMVDWWYTPILFQGSKSGFKLDSIPNSCIHLKTKKLCQLIPPQIENFQYPFIGEFYFIFDLNITFVLLISFTIII